MTAPTKEVRGRTYLRDGFRCVSCGRTEGLQWNHRESSGQGGRGKKAPPLTPADGVTSCWDCNPRYESNMQDQALALGWKLRRNRGSMRACEVPFFDRNVRRYFLPDEAGNRVEIVEGLAMELLAAAGNLRPGKVAA